MSEVYSLFFYAVIQSIIQPFAIKALLIYAKKELSFALLSCTEFISTLFTSCIFSYTNEIIKFYAQAPSVLGQCEFWSNTYTHFLLNTCPILRSVRPHSESMHDK